MDESGVLDQAFVLPSLCGAEVLVDMPNEKVRTPLATVSDLGAYRKVGESESRQRRSRREQRAQLNLYDQLAGAVDEEFAELLHALEACRTTDSAPTVDASGRDSSPGSLRFERRAQWVREEAANVHTAQWDLGRNTGHAQPGRSRASLYGDDVVALHMLIGRMDRLLAAIRLLLSSVLGERERAGDGRLWAIIGV